MVKNSARRGERLAAREHDALEHPVASFERDDALLAHRDAVALERARGRRRRSLTAVGAQHEIAAPGGQLQRESGRRARPFRRSRSADRELPSRRSTGQWNTLRPYSSRMPSISGRLSHDAGGDQQLARRDDLLAVVERHLEASVSARTRVGHGDVAQFDGVVPLQLAGGRCARNSSGGMPSRVR